MAGGADEQRSTGLAALRSAERKILSASSVHGTHEADFLMSECGMWMAESRIPISESSFLPSEGGYHGEAGI
jgi:hypothetical protein